MAQQSLIDAAKRPVTAFCDKNWNEIRDSVSRNVQYEEIATHRKTSGVDQLIECWQGWSNAFPDSRAEFRNSIASGTTVVLELTWRGTHKGMLKTPTGKVESTGKSVEVPACLVTEIVDGKARSIRHYFDMATILQQLGLAKAA